MGSAVTSALAPAGSRPLAIALLWLTIAWNVVEGAVAVTSGAAAESVALVGFGIDSFIEVTAAAVLIWRLGAERDASRERIAHAVVGATFIALAAYIAGDAAYVFATDAEPEASGIGLALAVASSITMPAIGLLKRRNAVRLGSPALVAESHETLICSYLSVSLFAGLALNAVAGWHLADVVAALVMLPWIVKEGIEGLRGAYEETDG